MTITIKKVTTKEELKKFIRFNYELYKDNPYSVPDLLDDMLNTFSPEKNAAFEFCEADYFLAYRGDEIVGRVAAIINRRANEIWNKKEVRFGWIDFIDEEEVSGALLKTVEEWGKARGMEEMVGPLGFTDMDAEGMLVEGFDQLSTMSTIYNYSYYPEHLEQLGFEKEVDWVEYLIKLPEDLPERYAKMGQLVLEKNRLRTRKLTMKEVHGEKYGQKMFRLINECYKDLYGYSLLSEKQMDQYVKQYLSFIDLRMVTFIEDENGGLVACGITLPSLSKALRKARGKLFPFGWAYLLNALYLNRPATLDLLLVAVKPEYRSKGLNSVMFCDLIPSLKKLGFKYAESNPELETNLKVQSLWTAFDHQIHKRRRVYAKSID